MELRAMRADPFLGHPIFIRMRNVERGPVHFDRSRELLDHGGVLDAERAQDKPRCLDVS